MPLQLPDKTNPAARLTLPTPENAMKARATAGAESWAGGDDPTNPLAATIVDDLSLHTTKPIFGGINAAKEWYAGNDPSEGWKAGTDAYDEALNKRREKAGWTGTIAGTGASGLTTGVLQGLGVPLPFSGAVAGASQMSNDPGSALAGGGYGALTGYLGGKVSKWAGDKLGNLFSEYGPKALQGPKNEVPPNILRRGAAYMADKTAAAIESGGEKAVQGGGLPAAAYLAYNGHPYLAAASAAAAVGAPAGRKVLSGAADWLRKPVQEAPGYVASIMNPRAHLAEMMAAGALNSNAAMAPAQQVLQGGW